MTQIYLNLSYIYFIPFLIGLLIGFITYKLSKSYIITISIFIFSIILFCIVSNINTHGSEGPMLRVIQITCIAFGKLIVDLIKLIRRLIKK